MIVLREQADSSLIMESQKASDGCIRLSGVLMQGEIKNRNGRIYPKKLLEEAVEEFSLRSYKTLGEIEHPDVLTINLERVSHVIESMEMDGNNVVGTLRIVNTPAGNILKGLVESGVDIPVSSRGGGNVVRNGDHDLVESFSFVTCDAVGSPSAPSAIMNMRESIENAHNRFLESVKTGENQELIKKMILDSLLKDFNGKR